MRLHHIAFRTADLERLVNFYERVFAPRRVREREGSVWLALDGAVLMIERKTEAEPEVPVGCQELVALRADDQQRQAMRSTLAQAGVAIEAETQHTLYFRDPDGRRLGVSSHPLTGSDAAPSPRAPSSRPSRLDRWLALRNHLSDDLFGGPRLLKASWVINLQKGGTLPFVLALMWAYDNWSATAWTYAALHGGYGLCWLLKDLVFPDPNWEKRVTFGGALSMWVAVLGLYWLAPWLIISQQITAPLWLMSCAVLLHTLGVVIMMSADAQKYFVLRARRGLITDGWFSRVRHPNYLGEMMLYGSYALLAQHPIPWLVLAWVWTGVFLPNMLAKERSMARYPQWEAYRARSGFLLPKLSPEAHITSK